MLGNSIPNLIGWKLTSFPSIFTGLLSLLTWLKGVNMCSVKKSDKNILLASDKWLRSSTGEMLAVLPHAPPLLIAHN